MNNLLWTACRNEFSGLFNLSTPQLDHRVCGRCGLGGPNEALESAQSEERSISVSAKSGFRSLPKVMPADEAHDPCQLFWNQRQQKFKSRVLSARTIVPLPIPPRENANLSASCCQHSAASHQHNTRCVHSCVQRQLHFEQSWPTTRLSQCAAPKSQPCKISNNIETSGRVLADSEPATVDCGSDCDRLFPLVPSEAEPRPADR